VGGGVTQIEVKPEEAGAGRRLGQPGQRLIQAEHATRLLVLKQESTNQTMTVRTMPQRSLKHAGRAALARACFAGSQRISQ